MESLMILYVTAEQETAVKQLFTMRAWMFNNFGVFLTEDVKNEILSAWELTKQNKGKSSDRNKTFPDELESSNIDEVTEDLSSLCKADAKEMAGDEDRRQKYSGENEVTEDLSSLCKTDAKEMAGDEDRRRKYSGENKVLSSKNVNGTFKSRPRKCKQNDRQKKCKRLVSTEKANQIRPSKGKHTVGSGVNDFSVGKRTRKGILLPGEDNPVQTKNGKYKQSDIKKGEKENSTSASKGSFETSETENFDDSIQEEEEISNGKDVDVEKDLKCDKCSYRTKIRSNLNRHVREIHSGVRHKCSKCNKTFKGKHDAKMHDLYGHSSSLHCKECDKTFSSVSGLRNHVKIKHKKRTLYQCKHCEMKFYYKSHYLGHVNKHLNVKPFSCNACQRPFRYKVACHLHEKTCSRENYYTTHNSDGSLKQAAKSKFLCDICGLELTSKSGLKLHHYYTHAEDTTTVCSLCGKSFKGTYSLQRHMRNSHDNTGTVYPCPECGKQFSQQQILKQHIKIHQKAYTCFCETCGKGFLSRFKMTEHTRMHTGEKPFSCPHCVNFKCATKTNLQKHMKIHKEGRVPRQKKEKKEPKKKQKTSAGKQEKCDAVKTGNYTEEVFIPLPMSSDSYATSAECTQNEIRYTNLPQMVLDNNRYNQPKSFNYDYLYKDHQDDNQKNSKCYRNMDCTLRTQYMNNEPEYMAYQMTVEKVYENQGERCYKTRNEEDKNSFVTNSCENEIERQSNYDMSTKRERQNDVCTEANGCYGNDTSTERSELPQGLSILTVAMNIVNPSEY